MNALSKIVIFIFIAICVSGIGYLFYTIGHYNGVHSSGTWEKIIKIDTVEVWKFTPWPKKAEIYDIDSNLHIYKDSIHVGDAEFKLKFGPTEFKIE